MKLGLEGSHALVTGGTKGLGKAIVEEFLREGCNVSYCARSATGDEFKSFEDRAPGITSKAQAIGTALDITDHSKLTQWVNESHAKFGRIDVVVANASAMNLGPTKEDWLAVFHTDITSLLVLLDAAVPFLESSPHPSLIVQSSATGRMFLRMPHGKAGGYGAIKAALMHHVNTLAQELGPKGIRVNALSAGIIFFEDGIWDKIDHAAPEYAQEIKDAIALKRRGAPDEVARVAVFTASPAASYVSGANMLITGGLVAGPQF